MRQWQRRVTAGLVAVCGLVASPGLDAQQSDPVPTRVSTLISRILTLDKDELTLRLEDADPEDLFSAGPALRALFALRDVGDRVNVTYYRPLVLGIVIGGGGPTLPVGVRPGQSAAIRPLVIDVTVLAINPDPSAPTITVHHTVFNVDRTYEVLRPHLLDGIQVGDLLTLTISRPLLSNLRLAP